MVEPLAVARPWARLAVAGVWLAPLAARLLVPFPMWAVLPFVAWGLAAVIALAWAVPAIRRLAFVPDAAVQGGASQAFLAAAGMVLVGLAIRYMGPALDPE